MGKPQTERHKSWMERRERRCRSVKFGDPDSQTRPVATGVCLGQLGFELLATGRTGALVQDEVVDLEGDRRQLDHLMGVVRGQGHQLAMATGTRPWFDQMDVGWTKQDRPAAWMTSGPRWGAPVRRGWRVGF